MGVPLNVIAADVPEQIVEVPAIEAEGGAITEIGFETEVEHEPNETGPTKFNWMLLDNAEVKPRVWLPAAVPPGLALTPDGHTQLYVEPGHAVPVNATIAELF